MFKIIIQCCRLDCDFPLTPCQSRRIQTVSYRISMLLSIHNLVGTVITVRLYTKVNGLERKVYEQAFNAVTDSPGLWVVNGTVGIHQALRVTLQSNDAADNGKEVDYDYLMEAM